VKAVILAGGKGTRGKPYTDYFPKAMIPLNGKPLIDYIIRYLSSFNFISEIIIIADFDGLGGQIKNYLQDSKYSKKISFVQDSQSGTGGDLLHIRKKLIGSSEFILWFVDNLSPINLKEMLQTFKKKNSIACIATRTKRKEETGFAIVDDGIIKKFEEKPTMKLKMSECLGVYILGNQILNKIKQFKQKEVNLSFHVLENLSKNEVISAYDIGNTPWLDVESPVVVDRYQNLVRKIIKQMER
jgi:mannose-1-phosphate guanylyltransferase